MTWTAVANCSGTNGDGIHATTNNMDSRTADLLIALVQSNAFASYTPTDSQGNTWLGGTEHNAGAGNPAMRIWYCAAPSTAASHNFNVTTSGASFPALMVSAWSGCDILSAFDAETASNSAANHTTDSPGSITPARSGSLCFAGFALTVDGTGLTVPSGYTFFGNDISAAYFLQGAAAPTNPTWLWTNPQISIATLTVFKPALAPGLANSILRPRSLVAHEAFSYD